MQSKEAKRLKRRVWLALLALPVLFYAHKPFYWYEPLRFDVLHLDSEFLGYYVMDLFPMYNYPASVHYSSENYFFKLFRNLILLLLSGLALNLFRLCGISDSKMYAALLTLKGFMLFNLFMFLMADNQWNWYLQVYCLVAFLILPHAFYMAFGKKYN